MSADKLNPGQSAVLACEAPRIVVSAGAGSGKTRVLAERFVELVMRAEADGDTSPLSRVLLITFTDKAAGELTERVRRTLLGRGRTDLAREVDNAWISTIHGFCARMVRRHALEIGVDPAFAVLVDPECGAMRRDAFEAAALSSIAADPAVAGLFDTYGAAVADTVIAGLDTIRSKGAQPSGVGAPPSTDMFRAIDRCIERMNGLMSAYAALPSTATLEGNLVRYRECLDLLTACGGSGSSPMGIAVELLARCPAFKGDRRGGAEAKLATAQLNEVIDDVLLDAADLVGEAHAAAWLALTAAYAIEYAARKRARGTLDFDDLQQLTSDLWRDHPSSAARYRTQFAEVMIDEFQDTTTAQLQAIEPVAGGCLCVVGDVQQSIYRFRDADVGVFISQREAIGGPGAGGRCELTVNYRSDPDLLSVLNDLFGAGHLFGDSYLKLEAGAAAVPGRAGCAEAILVDKAGTTADVWRRAEAAEVASRLRALVDEGRCRAGDIAVLVRSTKTMPPFVQELEAHGFDVLAAAAGGLYAAPEVADVRALLRVLANPLDDEGVVGLLAGGLGGLSDDALCLLAASGRGMWEALADPGGACLETAESARAGLVRGTVEAARSRMGRVRLADVILDVAGALGPEGGCFESPAAWANVRKIARLAAEFERVTPADPAAFLAHLSERETYVSREAASALAVEGADAVRVMTVHAAKGLEFPVVAVVDLGHERVSSSLRFIVAKGSEGLIVAARPSTEKGAPAPRAWTRASEREATLEIEESKRVFYVACSRAERFLLLSGAADLGKEPDSDRAVDWLRRAIEGSRIPGLAVRTVVATDAQPTVAATPAAVRPVAECAAIPSAEDAGEPAPVPRELSYTALSLYERCPYSFYARRVLGITRLDTRTFDDPRGLGSALHAALQIVSEDGEVDPPRLHSLARMHALTAEGEARLSAALASVLGSRSADLMRSGAAEVPFALRLDGGMVVGTMDLVVSDACSALVLDYKTGDASERTESIEAQAGVYALALLSSGHERVEVRFIEVEQGCRETPLTFTTADRARLAERVEAAFAGMAAGTFPRLEAFDTGVCPDCPVSGGLCPITHPGVVRPHASR